jgi:hypothetical protein
MGPFHFSSAGALARRASGTNHHVHTESLAVTGDGQLFLISRSPPATPAIEVVVNGRAAAEP